MGKDFGVFFVIFKSFRFYMLKGNIYFNNLGKVFMKF